MLRLIIVDDEKIIRETISRIIDWKSLGIDLIGICKNGIEAYDMIIDEYPDIVLTDIKMPGLSGLELIEKIKEVDNNIQFIILSGYGEFDFAKKAMKYGVKHYLLKPCNEKQIIDVIKQVSQDCLQLKSDEKLQENHKILKENYDENMMRNIIMEGLAHKDELTTFLAHYKDYLDFSHTPYNLYYIYYLTEEHLQSTIFSIKEFLAKLAVDVVAHFVYVTNTLMVFYQSNSLAHDNLSTFFESLNFEKQRVPIEYKKEIFSNLHNLLETLINKIDRYEFIYYVHNDHLITTYNHNSFFIKINHILEAFTLAESFEKEVFLSQVRDTLLDIKDENLLKAIITTLLMDITNTNLLPISPINITDFLLEINTLSGCELILNDFMNKLSHHIDIQSAKQSEYKDFIEEALHYINENLSNPNLSLKWIAENILYMNVDYLSKQFIKETGYRFSYYLTSKRIEKAKKLLIKNPTDPIYAVAKKVGCGNNPQYFSQIFKKYTGMTPTAYLKRTDS